jgi:site-specific DNA recombinase
MKLAAIYARVSTERQEEQKTIESQLSELREVCEKSGVEIVKEYIDDGFSGSILARPGLDRLRDDVSKNLFDAVYILSPDRLARKYLYQALVLEELKKKGIEVVFLNKAVTDSPEDQLLLGIEGLVAEYERAKIFERTRRGRLHRAKIGEIMGGSAPFGYDYIRKTNEAAAHYRVNDKEAEVVRMIFSLYIKAKSTAKVVRILGDKKIRPRCNSEYWSKGVIHKMLTSECYIGTAYYNKNDKSPGNRRKREKNDWIPIRIPKILDNETFELARKILSNQRGGKRIRVYVLSGLIRCANCGSRYIGLSANKARSFYYRCGNIVKRFPLPRDCYARPVRAEIIEAAVLDAVKNAILRPQILIDHISKLAQNLIAKGKNAKLDEEKLTNTKNFLGRKKARLLELYLESQIQKSAYLEKLREIEEKERELVETQEKAEDHPVCIDQSLIIQSVNYFSDLAKKRLESFRPYELREFLLYLIDEIKFDSLKMEAKIAGHIPLNRSSNKLDPSLGLFHAHPGLPLETGNHILRFELEVKV